MKKTKWETPKVITGLPIKSINMILDGKSKKIYRPKRDERRLTGPQVLQV